MKRDINSSKIHERRKKRLVMPAVYFILEIVFVWLVLSLIELKFDLRDWTIWSIGIFIVLGGYFSFKMLNIYNRQESYK